MRRARTILRTLAPLVFVVSLMGSVPTQAGDECFDRDPVGVVVVTIGADSQGSTTSADFPVATGSRTLTRAAVTVNWEKRDGMVRLTPRFHYSIPGQVGLAYNFFQLVWSGPVADGHNEMIRHDLTRSCSGPGVAIFPNQAWEPGEYSYTTRDVPGAMVVFLVWGRLG